MFEIIGQSQKKAFTVQQLTDMLPLIYRVTEEYSKDVKYLMGCVEAMPNKDSSRCLELQDQINELIQKWQNKIERLGGKPKGLWMADFDNGSGYFCWKFPETEVKFCHGYQDGFTGRKTIENQNISDQNEGYENSPSPN